MEEGLILNNFFVKYVNIQINDLIAHALVLKEQYYHQRIQRNNNVVSML